MFDMLLTPLMHLTVEVGEMIMSFYKSNIAIEIKSDQTPLTIADKTAHQMIVAGLNKLTPNTPIVSEEGDICAFEQRQKWREYWLIDPLDGTRDFLEHTHEFCICIAYIKNHNAVFGMIYAPYTQTHYYGFNHQSFKVQNNLKQRLIARAATHPLRVVVGHHSKSNPQLKNHLKQQGDYQISQLGSALKFCEIASGNYDYYPRFGPCSEWDTAAGICILQAAGGEVVDEHGKKLKYNTKDDLLSPIFFASGAGLKKP